MVRKTVKVWILSSIATSEAHESESGLETKCYERKGNKKGTILEWLLTMRMVTTTARISVFTLSLTKSEAFF